MHFLKINLSYQVAQKYAKHKIFLISYFIAEIESIYFHFSKAHMHMYTHTLTHPSAKNTDYHMSFKCVFNFMLLPDWFNKSTKAFVLIYISIL